MKKLLTILFLFVSSIAFAQHQWDTYVTASGTDTYAVTVSVPTMTNYSTKRIHLRFANANTGTSTLNVTPIGGSPLGAVAIRAWDGDSWEALTGGEIATGQDYVVVHNGTFFELYPSISGGSGSGSVNDSLRVKTVSTTTYTPDQEDHNYLIYLTNASTVTITLDNTLDAHTILNFRRDTGAGQVIFISDGTSVLTSRLDYDTDTLKTELATCTWIKRNSTEFSGVGAFGDAATGGGGGDVSSVFGRTGAVVAASGDYEASEVTNTPAGSIAATDVQTALNELDTEKQPLDADLTSWSGVTRASGFDTFTATPSSANFASLVTDETGTGSVVFSASPALTGNPTAPTQSPGTNNTTIATTAYVDAAVTAGSIPDGDKGDITVTGSTWTIDNLVVTPAKMSTFSSSDMRGKYTDETGTGAAYFQGGDIGTPSAGVGTFITGIPYANLTGTVPFYSLSTGGTLTGPNTFTGTTTNIVKYVFNGLSTTQTNGAGLWLANTDAAAAGAQQISPSVVFEGQGWKTDATAGTQSVKVALDMLPVQGAANPSVSLRFRQSINGGAYSNLFSLIPNGNSIFTSNSGGTSYSFQLAAGTNYFRINETGSALFGSTTSDVRIGSGTGSTFGISGNSLIVQAGGTQHFTTTNSANLATASATIYNFTGAAMTGSGGSNPGVWARINPVYNTTGGTSPVYDFLVEATETAISGTHYGVVNPSTTARNGFGTSTPTERLDVNGNGRFTGNVTLSAAGNGIYVKEGSNATMGSATLSAGSVTVNTTKVTANSRIFLTTQSLGTVATPKSIAITARSAGTSFTITSEDGTDTSVVAWMIIEPAP